VHEQSIVEHLLALAVQSAEQAKATKILRIYIVVGELSGVVDEAVEFYFELLGRDTIAAKARLFFMHIPAQLRCRNCDTVFAPRRMAFNCPNCNEQQVEIIAGRELYLERIEVE
jgi:hydrogenase nickel incorporation protein HypA/HybF